MESLTVRGIRDEERGFKWGGGEEGRTKKNLLFQTMDTLIAATGD